MKIVDNKIIANGIIRFDAEGVEMTSLADVEDTPRLHELMRECLETDLCILASGDEFLQMVEFGSLSDDNTELLGVYVDDMLSNAGLDCDTFSQGEFRFTSELWRQQLVQNFDVRVHYKIRESGVIE